MSYTLDEEKKERDDTFINIRMNKSEMAMLRELKDIFDTDQNTTALKATVEIGYNVLHSHFSGTTLQRLFKKERVRRIK